MPRVSELDQEKKKEKKKIKDGGGLPVWRVQLLRACTFEQIFDTKRWVPAIFKVGFRFMATLCAEVFYIARGIGVEHRANPPTAFSGCTAWAAGVFSLQLPVMLVNCKKIELNPRPWSACIMSGCVGKGGGGGV